VEPDVRIEDPGVKLEGKFALVTGSTGIGGDLTHQLRSKSARS
jgi:hypothetical protein